MSIIETATGIHLVGDYARVIKLNEENQKRLADKYSDLIDAAANNRGEEESLWERIMNAYKCKPTAPPIVKWFPQIFVPLLATDVEGTFTRLYSTLTSTDPFWSRKTSLPLADTDQGLEQYLHGFTRQSSWEPMLSDSLLQLAKLGSCVIKVPRQKDVLRKSVIEDGRLAWRNKVIRTVPKPRSVYLGDFYISQGARDVGSAHWVAERTKLSWGQIKLREEQKVYFDVDRIKEAYKENVDTLEKEWELYMVYAFEDVNDDGLDEDISFIFEKSTHTILRAQVNPCEGYRPYAISAYIPREFSPFGKGVGEMDLPLNEEINVIHNAVAAGTVVANCKVFVHEKGPMGSDLSELEVWPFRFLSIAQGDKLQTLDLGNPGAVMGLTIQHDVERQAGREHGVTDLASGQGDTTQGSRATATSTMALLNMSAQRMDLPLNVFRYGGLSDIASILLKQGIQYGPGDAIQWVDEDKRELVKGWFKENDTIPEQMQFSVTATTAAETRTAKRAAYTELAPMVQMYLTKKVEMAAGYAQAMAAQDFLTMATLKLVSKASDHFFTEMLKTYDLRDEKQLIITNEEVLKEVERVITESQQTSDQGLGGEPDIHSISPPSGGPLEAVGGPGGLPLANNGGGLPPPGMGGGPPMGM